MKVLLDGLSVLADHWRLLPVILSIMLLGQLLVWAVLKKILGDKLTSEEYFSLGIGGWMVPVSLASLLWFLWGMIQAPQSSAFILFILLAILTVTLFFRIGKQAQQDSRAIIFILLAVFGISAFLRLVFASEVLLPSYFDSAEHYRIIKDLMGNQEMESFEWPTTNYYHLGFHLLAAFISSLTHAEITSSMLILGQMILAATPLSIFFILQHETRSNSAGIFAVLLAGFGWYMPAYAVNWGKYPALASLALIQFVVSMAYLAIQSKHTLPSSKRWALHAMLGSGLLLSGFIHSRSLVIFGIAVLAWITSTRWQKLTNLPRYFVFFIIILGILLEIIFIQSQDIFKPLFDPYIPKGWLVTSIVLFLSIFALKTYPHLAFVSIVAILLFLGCLFIPVEGFLPGYGDLTLLDRPFVEMLLYLPLSLLGGLGLAGLQQTLLNAGNFQLLWGKYIGVLFIGLVLMNAFTQYELYPSDCCDIAGPDDLVAIDWMDKNLPLDAQILISSTELRVLASDSFQGYNASDAGAWITPLISRPTIPLPYNSDLGQPAIFDTLCIMKIDYIYVGETGQTFDASQLRAHPNWYKSLLTMPRAGLYQIVGCN